MTIEFYKLFIFNKDKEATDINPHELLEKINSLELEKANMENFLLLEYDKNPYSSSQLKFGCFTKPRKEQNPFYIHDNNLEVIDEALVEINCFLFIPESHLFIFALNRHGVKINKIESYLNSFLKEKELNANFQKVTDKKRIEEIYDSKKIKAITIKATENYISKNDTSEHSITNTFHPCMDLLRLESKTVKISVENKEEGLEIARSIDFIKKMREDLENDDLLEVIVKYKNPIKKDKKINLKDLNTHLKDKILKNHKGKILRSTVYESIKHLYYESYTNLNIYIKKDNQREDILGEISYSKIKADPLLFDC